MATRHHFKIVKSFSFESENASRAKIWSRFSDRKWVILFSWLAFGRFLPFLSSWFMKSPIRDHCEKQKGCMFSALSLWLKTPSNFTSFNSVSYNDLILIMQIKLGLQEFLKSHNWYKLNGNIWKHVIGSIFQVKTVGLLL